jgi:hypothetical protein
MLCLLLTLLCHFACRSVDCHVEADRDRIVYVWYVVDRVKNPYLTRLDIFEIRAFYSVMSVRRPALKLQLFRKARWNGTLPNSHTCHMPHAT